MKMLNSRTITLDHILCMGTTSKGWEVLGYQKGSSGTKTIVQKNARLKSAESKGNV